jgi:hypothetical protein
MRPGSHQWSSVRGRRECRAPMAPAAPRAKNESTQISPPQVHRTSRHSLRDGVTASFVLSPAIGLFVAVVGGCFADVMPASRHQDHTTSPSAFIIARQSMRQRPSHPAPNVRDDREAPSLEGRGTREEVPVICPTSQAIGLRQINATGKSGPAGKTVSIVFVITGFVPVIHVLL